MKEGGGRWKWTSFRAGDERAGAICFLQSVFAKKKNALKIQKANAMFWSFEYEHTSGQREGEVLIKGTIAMALRKRRMLRITNDG